MRSKVTENHVTDEHGKPAGGTTYGNGFAIGWQHGPLGRGEDRKAQNGAFVEDVIVAAIGRIEHYESTEFACDANAAALDFLRSALDCLNRRTAEREARGVEGTHAV